MTMVTMRATCDVFTSIRSGSRLGQRRQKRAETVQTYSQTLMLTAEASLPWFMADREEAMEPAGKMTEDMEEDGTITVCCG